MSVNSEILFLGNCQMSRFAQFYGVFTPPAQKIHRTFLSITPHYGKYDEEQALTLLKTAEVAVVQLILSDYIFSRDAVLKLRAGKPTIFVPYVYLQGFRRLERIASKGVDHYDGADPIRAEIARVGANKAALNYMRGDVSGDNLSRFMGSLDALRDREAQGADVKIADYIAETFRDRVPCYSINHPAPHVLFAMYNQITAKLDLPAVDETKLTPYEIGRATLPQGHCALTPYCVAALGLNYDAEVHWFATTNRLVQQVVKLNADEAS